jgi:hypothetical protein
MLAEEQELINCAATCKPPTYLKRMVKEKWDEVNE